jgi:hypothetical protein
MTREPPQDPPRGSEDHAASGVVARLSTGGWTAYHRQGCIDAPHRGEPGVRDVIHGPWRYLASHWSPCPRCRPPGALPVPRRAA